MQQPEGFIEPGYEDYICKLVHTIYGMMQGAHDWYETLRKPIKILDIPHHAQIHVSDSKRETETIP